MEIKFANQTILVTGGTGFIGSHLIEKLSKTRNHIITTYQSIDKGSYFFQKHLDTSVAMLQGDIRNFSFISHIVTKYHVDFIYHLAAQALVNTAYDNPKETLETNINGTISVLETARLYPSVKAVILASSDKAYGKLAHKKYSESDPLQGDHPYEVSKTAADMIGTTYWKTYQTPVVIARFGNVYGEGDTNFSRIIPSIMHSIITQTPLLIRSDGKYVRDYLYITDVIDGYISLINKYKNIKGESFNFGSKESLSVMDIIKICESVLNKKIKYKILNNTKNEIPYQSLQYKKATNVLKWKPHYLLKNTLSTILLYYQKLYEMQKL